MIRGLFTVGLVLFLAAAAVWAYRQYGFPLTETRQADAAPVVPDRPQDVPAPPAAPHIQPVPEHTPVPPLPETRPAGQGTEPGSPPAPAPDTQQRQPERPSIAPLPEQIPDPPTPRVGKKTHVVRPGETLWEISRTYFRSPAYVEQIADTNHLDAPNLLRPGMVLVLPEIPGLNASQGDSTRPAPRVSAPEHVNAPQRTTPMPPTLSRTVTVE